MEINEHLNLIDAARTLGEDGILFDPTDDEIILAAAELIDRVEIIDGLTAGRRARIVATWEAASKESA